MSFWLVYLFSACLVVVLTFLRLMIKGGSVTFVNLFLMGAILGLPLGFVIYLGRLIFLCPK
jgi:hypothetical protein